MNWFNRFKHWLTGNRTVTGVDWGSKYGDYTSIIKCRVGRNGILLIICSKVRSNINVDKKEIGRYSHKDIEIR